MANGLSAELSELDVAIADRALRHAVLLEGLKRGEARRVSSFLVNEVLPDIEERLAARLGKIVGSGIDRGPGTTKRLRELHDFTAALALEATGKIADDQRDMLRTLAASEARSEVRGIASVLSKFGEVPASVTFDTPSVASLRALVSSRPYEGRILREWWDSVGTSFAENVRKQVAIGAFQGETAPQITARVFGLGPERFGVGAPERLLTNAETVAITSIAHVSQSVRDETARKNSRLLRGVRLLPTLDLRTSPICRGLDPKIIYPVDSGPRSPLHPRCRTQLSWVTKSLRELGIKTKQKGLEPGPEFGGQASIDGTVPTGLSYDDFLRRQPAKVQDHVLGKAKADVFRRGKLKLDRFVDNGRELSVRELEDLERSLDEGPGPGPTPPPPAPPKDRPPTPKPKPVGTPAPEPLESAEAIRAKLATIAKENEEAIATAKARTAEALKRSSEAPWPKYDRTKPTAEADREYQSGVDAVRALQDAAQAAAAAERKIIEAARVKERAVLVLPESERLSIAPRNKVPKPLAKTWDEGKTFVEKSVRKGAKTARVDANGVSFEVDVKQIRGQRAYYQRQYHAISINRDSDVATVVHELGHAIETASDWIPRTREFLLRRAAGEPSRALKSIFPNSGYGRDERTFRDKFENPYIGKDYGDQATEIVSMGLQYLWERPADFAAADRDFFDFIFNLIRGTS